MNYYEIGQRIRKYRKACNLSQEQLAEAVGISSTHMSHIETGNTKLSLPVLVDIANILSVQTDAIIYDKQPLNKSTLVQELSNIVNSCSENQLHIIVDILQSLKISLDKYSN